MYVTPPSKGKNFFNDSIQVPDNTFIVGEAWSQFVAFGQNFANDQGPMPMLSIGSGNPANIEIQNVLFTSQGSLPGLILVQWTANAKTQGSVGMWGKSSFLVHDLYY